MYHGLDQTTSDANNLSSEEESVYKWSHGIAHGCYVTATCDWLLWNQEVVVYFGNGKCNGSEKGLITLESISSRLLLKSFWLLWKYKVVGC